MMVPLYLNLVDGRTIRLEVVIHGEHTVDQTLQLPPLPAAVKNVSINNNYDVLCTQN
ncbi:MAG: hypothetical protein WDM87_10280 [Terracidiphilus sp.]